MDGRLAGEQGMAGLFTILNNRRSTTVRTGIIEPDFWKLELPFLVRSTIFCFFCFFCFFVLSPELRGPVFAALSSPYPREGISDVLARGSIIPVLTVGQVFH